MEDERCRLYHSIGCGKCYIPECPYDRLPSGYTTQEVRDIGNDVQDTLMHMQIAGWCAECRHYQESEQESPERYAGQISLELGDEEFDRMQYDYEDNEESFNPPVTYYMNNTYQRSEGLNWGLVFAIVYVFTFWTLLGIIIYGVMRHH